MLKKLQKIWLGLKCDQGADMKRSWRSFFLVGGSAFAVLIASAFVPQAKALAGDEPQQAGRNVAMLPLSGEIQNGIRIVNAKALQYSFDPNPVVVGQGDRVQLVVLSPDMTHNLTIVDNNVAVTVPAGETRTVVFTADTEGVFDIDCSTFVGSGRSHTTAKLIVK
jgi:heme/copper-type cytochrome/quinol oxidase subunit 2